MANPTEAAMTEEEKAARLARNAELNIPDFPEEVSDEELQAVDPGADRKGRERFMLSKGWGVKQARARIEKLRGIERDADGKIARSQQWVEDRVRQLIERRNDFVIRDLNAQREITGRINQLKSMGVSAELVTELETLAGQNPEDRVRELKPEKFGGDRIVPEPRPDKVN